VLLESTKLSVLAPEAQLRSETTAKDLLGWKIEIKKNVMMEEVLEMFGRFC